MPPSLNDLEGEMASVQYIREALLPELVPCAYILLSQILRASSVFRSCVTYAQQYSDLLHDVSLRSDTNRMDAFNLAIVICPNLVKSSNPMRDVMMCTVPVSGTSTPSRTTSTATLAQLQLPRPLPEGEGKTTLGIVIALCIRRYYEIFDEVVDRHDAVAPWGAVHSHEWGANGESSASGSPRQPTYVLEDGEDEDDIDDGILVMSVGIENKSQPHSSASSGPPSAWGPILQPQWIKQHKGMHSKEDDVWSMYNDHSSSSAYNGPLRSFHPHTGNSKARSMVSIDGSGHSSANSSSGMRRGSITIGRSTTRKGSGAPVEAISVVASGFFTPPASELKPITTPRLKEQDKNAPDEEGKVLTVGERRRMFESRT